MKGFITSILYLFALSLLPGLVTNCSGQNSILGNILITGKVTDAETGQPIPFTQVSVEGKFIGTTTDMDGNYRLEVNKRVDTLTAVSLGYKTLKMPVSKDREQVINFVMHSDRLDIPEVIVTPGENPADVLMKEIIKHKDKNDYARLPTANYTAYTKYEIDLSDFNAQTIDKNKLLNKFPVLKDYLDTTTIRGTSILPIFLVENYSQNFEQQSPHKTHEIIEGVKMSGLQKQDFITQLLSNVNQHLDIYENLMGVMGKSLVSPIADYGLSVYNYKVDIYDTIIKGGEKYLEMTFKPKRKDEYAFKGTMIVNLRTFAIQSVDMTLNENINIGFIKELSFTSDFREITYKVKNDSTSTAWVPNRELLTLKFNYNFGGEQKIIGKKTKIYRNFEVNEPLPDTAFSAFEATSIEKEANSRTDDWWKDTARAENLTAREMKIGQMLDTIKSMTRFKVIAYSLQTAATGFFQAGPVEFGHIANIISSNDIEKIRLRMGIRTTPKLTERLQLQFYSAYGFKDNRVKYGGSGIFIFSKKPWNKLTLTGRTDIDFKSQHPEEFDEDNIFTLVNKNNQEAHFYNVEEFKLDYETELHRDLMGYLTIQHETVSPYFSFGYVEDGVERNDFTTSNFSVTLRWQYHTQPLPGVYYRETAATKFFNMLRKKTEWPIVKFTYKEAFKDIINSDFNYKEIMLGLQGDLQITAKMNMYYNFTAGQIFGTVPFLLLETPEGNFSYVYNKYYFDDMGMLEFAADRYLSLNYQWHLGGVIFDKIPGFNKLKWREVITSNIFWGDMTQANRSFNDQNTFLIASPKPYAEAGVGIENIFKFLRIDSIWRLTYRNTTHTNKEVLNWALYVSMYLKI